MEQEERPLGFVIRALRTKADLSQEELGAMSGLTQDQISKIERGNRRLAAEELAEISRALGRSVDQLQQLRKIS